MLRASDTIEAKLEMADRPPAFKCAEVWGGNRAVESPITLPGINGFLVSRPCDGGQGGDIHYTSICGSGLISRMCLADVTGHGEAVGAVSAEIHTLLRKHMNAMDERVVLRSLNRRLADGQFDRLTTAAAVSYFPPMRELSVSYAGHPPAWVYRVEQKRWKRLPPGSEGDGRVGLVDLPLGVDQATRFSRRRERVATGDRLLVLTDGILEAPSPGGDLFGVEQLEALLAEGADLTVQELADAILGSLRSHAGSDRLDHDDVTMLLVEFVPGPRGLGTVWHMMKNRLLPKRWH